jgi:hypothetical protein
MIWRRGLAIWFLIIFAESIHGTLRELLLAPRIGDLTARRAGVVTGTAIIFAITMLTIRWIGAVRPIDLIAIGIGWAGLTIAFEALLGAWVFGYPKERIIADFDIRQGGLMGFGILFMVFVPVTSAIIRGSGPGTDHLQDNKI